MIPTKFNELGVNNLPPIKNLYCFWDSNLATSGNNEWIDSISKKN